MTREELPLSEVLATYEDGDGIGWAAEFAYLRSTPEHVVRLDALRNSVASDGIRHPVTLGYDGRIWDGHHRLCVADELGLETVPVCRAVEVSA